MRLKTIKFTILVVGMISVVLFLVLNFFSKVNPRDMIKNRLDLTIPVTSKIINFEYHNNDDSFYAKILIDKRDVESIKNDLINYFKDEYTLHSIREIPRCENFVNWWDMDKEKIEECYKSYTSGKPRLFRPTPKTIDIWAFIVKQNDETYYLYIAA